MSYNLNSDITSLFHIVLVGGKSQFRHRIQGEEVWDYTRVWHLGGHLRLCLLQPRTPFSPHFPWSLVLNLPRFLAFLKLTCQFPTSSFFCPPLHLFCPAQKPRAILPASSKPGPTNQSKSLHPPHFICNLGMNCKLKLVAAPATLHLVLGSGIHVGPSLSHTLSSRAMAASF